MYLLKVFLVSALFASISGAPVDAETTTEEEYEIEIDEPPAPFNREEYKKYLLDLKCMDIVINHSGRKTPEVPSGTIYIPTTTTTTTERSSDKRSDDASEEKKVIVVSDNPEETKKTKTKRSTGSSETPVPAAPSAENNTSEVNNTEVCTAPLTDKWDTFDWYQILVDNGGAPRTLDVTGAKPNLTRAKDPCTRPLMFESPVHDKVWYITKSLQPDKRIYRQERVSLRFPDTPHEFVDIDGLFVWSPPGENHQSYHISYRKDDTGLYVSLEKEQRCRFTDPLHTFGVTCTETGSIECTCVNGREVCVDLETPISLSPALTASLIGR